MKKQYFSPLADLCHLMDQDVISTSLGVTATGTEWVADWNDRISGIGKLDG